MFLQKTGLTGLKYWKRVVPGPGHELRKWWLMVLESYGIMLSQNLLQQCRNHTLFLLAYTIGQHSRAHTVINGTWIVLHCWHTATTYTRTVRKRW